MKENIHRPNRVLIVGTKSSTNKATKQNPQKYDLIPLPLLDTSPLSDIQFSGKKYDWLIFTSPAAVKHFHKLSDKPEFSKVAVIGPSTCQSAELLNLQVDFIPKEYNSESFGKELTQIICSDSKVLFPCSELADNSLEAHFVNKGITLERVNIYKPDLLPKPELPEFDSIAFLSGSSASAMHQYFGTEVLQGKKIAAIGSKAAKKVYDLFGLQALIPQKSTAEDTIKELL